MSHLRDSSAGPLVALLAAMIGCAPAAPPASNVAAPIPGTSRGEVAHGVGKRSDLAAQMDALSPELNQHLEQWPPLVPPVDEDDPIVMSVDESRRRLQQAISFADDGLLSDAMTELTGRCHPDVGEPWDLLWAEVSALLFHRQDVFPLAARYSAFALQIRPRSGAVVIRDKLHDEAAWAWRFEGATKAVPLPNRLSDDRQLGEPAFFLTVQGYSNQEASDDLDRREQPIQIFHFAVFLNSEHRYLFSYVVQGRKLAGEQVCYLEHRVSRRPDVIHIFDGLPAYQDAEARVAQHLEQTILQEETR